MSDEKKPLVGVLAIQGAFEEHQACLEASGCRTKQIRTVADMTAGGETLDGMVLPGGESTAMGLIGTATKEKDGKTVWEALRDFIEVEKKPTWGTCAGMILLAERCVGASAVIQDGQALIGGMDILVCRNYFGSQVSSFEMATPPPPTSDDETTKSPYPGVFIRAPAILSAGRDVTVLGKVVATPCAADGSNAREVICAVRKNNLLCTAFHPELTNDYRWHQYFAQMVKKSIE
eukprot:jgi/Psemu1/198423/e_gw1.219.56.1